MPKILVCAATRTEAEGSLAGIRMAGLSEHFEILPTGIGPEKAAESLKNRLARGHRPSLVVSTGFAGSWSGELDAGSWICAPVISNELGDQVPGKSISSATRVSLCSVAEIHETAPADLLKQLAVQGLPVAVDMESFALAQVAQNQGLELLVLRYITDSPKHPLPEFVRHFTEVAVRKDLRSRAQALARGTRSLLKPGFALPLLVKNGLHWRKELVQGWSKFAKTLI